MKKIFYSTCFLLIGYTSFSQPVCESSDTSSLEINNARAMIFGSADKWWDLIDGLGGMARYEIPKGSGKTSMFAGSLWIGGYDGAGNLKVAGQTYRQNISNDFFPGPVGKINGVAYADTANCSIYDHVWNFTKAEILNFINTGVATPDMLTYPANGNTSLGELPILAPYFDNNGDGVYDPTQGDYPLMDVYNNLPDSIDYLHGEQCLYSIYNDAAWVKTETSSLPMNLEIRSQSYAFPSPIAAINNTTFYEYRIINRSSLQYDSLYLAHWADPDLGDAADDYVGCDLPSNMGYCYNGDSYDGTASGYGANPPAIGIKVLEGPLAPLNDGIDNNHDNVTDETNEEWGMTSFMSYNNDFTIYGNPQGMDDYYSYMTGQWTNNTSALCPNTSTPTTYMFPGTSNPACLTNWTEATAGNPPGDRRIVMGTGPFTLPPDEEVKIVYAVVWSQAASAQASVDSLIADAETIENFYRNGFTTSIKEISSQEKNEPTYFYPNPTKGIAKLMIPNTKENETFTLQVSDVMSKLVYKNQSVKNKFELNTQEYNKGIYFYTVSDNKGFFYTGKLIVN